MASAGVRRALYLDVPLPLDVVAERIRIDALPVMTRLLVRVPASSRPTAVTATNASGFRVDDAGRKAQLHLRPCADFTPDRQFPADQCGAFRHAAQPVVSLQPLVGEHLRIDPLAIVAHAQSELLVVVADLDLDSPGLRMPEGVAQGFRRDLVDLVADDRMQIPRLALDGDAEFGRLSARSRELASSSPRVLIAIARSLRSSVEARNPCTASRPSVIAFAA